MRCSRRLPFPRGVSLLDLLVATGILAMFLLPIVHMLSTFSGASRHQKAESVAANLAKEEMNWWLTQADAAFLAGADRSGWNFRNPPQEIEGNSFELGMKIRFHGAETLVMTIPRFNWHDFIHGEAGFGPCSNGIERRLLASGTDVIAKAVKLGEISIDRAKRSGFYDFLLRIRWKLPNEADFNQINTRYLFTRRALLP